MKFPKDVYCSMGYSQLSLNGHLYKTDTSVKRTPRVGPCLCLFPVIKPITYLLYPVDNATDFPNTCPLDSDLSGG